MITFSQRCDRYELIERGRFQKGPERKAQEILLGRTFERKPTEIKSNNSLYHIIYRLVV